jgi:serine/threonine protein kinase
MEPVATVAPCGRPVGRYVLYDEFASGGMATVHFGRLRGEGGFTRTVAIKRLHPQFARDPDFVAMLVDEARIAARIKHPHVVAPFDVIAIDDRELLLVMEYVHGEVLSKLLARCTRLGRRMPLVVATSIMAGALHGLHAAHEATDEIGSALDIVHRDVSPPNILVGADGVARVLDFGVAKATTRASTTGDQTTKGKLAYMSPEQWHCQPLDRRTDVFAAGVVLWEMLALRRLFVGDDPAEIGAKVSEAEIVPASQLNPEVPPALDRVVGRALARDREDRYGSAQEFALALEKALPPATPQEVGAWVADVAGEGLGRRARLLALIESAPLDDLTPPSVPSLLSLAGSPPTTLPLVRGLPDAQLPQPPLAMPARRRSRRRDLAVGIGATLLLLVTVGAVGAEAWRRSLAPPLVPPMEGPRLAVAPPAPALDRIALPVPEPPAPNRKVAAADPPVRPAKVHRRRSRARWRARAGVDCDPPYVVDARGIRRVKPACVKR